MTSTGSPQRYSVHERVAVALHAALDPENTRPQRVQRMRDGASARGAVNAALADSLEEWNAMYPDALLHLPAELVHAIFCLLEFRDRITVSLVSRGWRATALADPFLWNVANFSVDPSRKWNPVVCYPPPGRPNWEPPPRPPPPRKADILRELLARSDPAPFSLFWETQEPPQLPDEMAELVLQNMHRVEEITADLSPRAFERLFAHPAPVLRTLSCTAASGPCELPACWDAPALSALALAIVRLPADMQPLATVEVLSCDELHYLGKDLFSLFPALTLLHIENAMPEVVRSLGTPPVTFEELVLRTECADAIEYGPLLAACRACSLDLLRLEAARELAPVLELFTRVVEGTWALKVDWDGRYVQLEGDTEDVDFAVRLVEPFAFAHEPHIASHFVRLSALSVDASLFAGVEAWEGTLPGLRELKLKYTRQPHRPSSPREPILAPLLEDVSIVLTCPEGAALWVTDEFPAMLPVRFAYDRPLLSSITIEADSDVALELDDQSLAGPRALAERARIEVRGRARE